MPKQQLSVVVTRRLPEVVETRLAELFDVKLRDTDAPMTRQELAEAIRPVTFWSRPSPIRSTMR